MTRPDEDRLRLVAWPGYLVAGTLFIVPLADAALTVWPYRVSLVQWRFGAAGVLSGGLMMPLVAVLLALVAATLLEHDRIVYVISLCAAAATMVLLAGTAWFMIDSLKMEPTLLEDARTPFTLAVVRVSVKLVLATTTAAGLSLAGMKASDRWPFAPTS